MFTLVGNYCLINSDLGMRVVFLLKLPLHCSYDGKNLLQPVEPRLIQIFGGQLVLFVSYSRIEQLDLHRILFAVNNFCNNLVHCLSNNFCNNLVHCLSTWQQVWVQVSKWLCACTLPVWDLYEGTERCSPYWVLWWTSWKNAPTVLEKCR